MIRRLWNWLRGTRVQQIESEIARVTELAPGKPGERCFRVETTRRHVVLENILHAPKIPRAGSKMVCTGVTVKGPAVDSSFSFLVTCTYEKEEVIQSRIQETLELLDQLEGEKESGHGT